MSFENVGLEVVGTARKVIVGKDENKQLLRVQATTKRSKIVSYKLLPRADNATSEYDKEQYDKRAAALSGKVAVIKVGGATEN
jgi:chaperonin GroEL